MAHNYLDGNYQGASILHRDIIHRTHSFTCIADLKSFYKLSVFDFAVTVAEGSLIAKTILSENPLSYKQQLLGYYIFFGMD